VLVNFPFSEYGPTGRHIAGGWKYLAQKHILRRHWKPGEFFNALFLDEFQESVTEMDARYLAQCRSHGGAMFALTQTIHSEYGSIDGHAGHHKADQLLANFGCHIYHLVDAKTAQFASELLGQRRELFINTSIQLGKEEMFDILLGRMQATVSANETYQPVLQPRVFMSDLRTGGPHNGYCVDGIVIRPGEPFRNNENWLWVSFRQR
jgi:hypothetical protein